jgi:hypothetical protein
MKHLARTTIFATVLLALTTTASWAASPVVEFQLDENYAEMDPAAGDGVLPEGEIDPNALDAGDEMPLPIADKAASAPKTEEATPEVAKKVEIKKPVAAAKTKDTEAREIPMIETSNESFSHADVTFVTGGIGDDELQAIEASKADYNLHVMSASSSGAFVGDSRVVITRKVGKETEEMLSVVAGPILYVRLPAGSYILEAKLGDQTKKQNFTVTKKGVAARVHLGWKVAATSSD